MTSKSVHVALVLALLVAFVPSLASCETQEELGLLTAREIRTKGGETVTLTGATITLRDGKGHQAVLTPTSLRFLSPEGRVVAEYSPTAH